MLALVSHDLKSSIHTTMGLSELWLMRLQHNNEHIDRQELIEDLDILISGSRDMLQLINNSLTAMRLESGMEAIELYWENELKEIFHNIGESFRPLAAAANIHLQTDIAATLPPVYWDTLKIRFHVIGNLLGNAMKFVEPGGKVVLSAWQEGEHIIISVADNGPGIPPAEREHLFHPAERVVEVTAERAFRCVRIGLYSANLFVEQHGGNISIEDGLDGRGVTFKISLPIDPLLQRPECGNC